MTNLADKHCKPCKDGATSLASEAAHDYMQQLSDLWQLNEQSITGSFEFKNYYRTTAFVNAVVWIAHSEDHHPDITFGYKHCKIVFTTHDVGGLSENDFISAARIDRLVD